MHGHKIHEIINMVKHAIKIGNYSNLLVNDAINRSYHSNLFVINFNNSYT